MSSKNCFTIKFSLYTLNMSNIDFGKNLAALRVNAGLTQKQMAEKIGIPASRLHADLIVKIAKILNISADAILGLNNTVSTQDEISLRLTKRMKKIDQLSEFKKKIILQIIDGYIRGEKVK